MIAAAEIAQGRKAKSRSRQVVKCAKCGREMVDSAGRPVAGTESESCFCWACTGFRGDPPTGAGRMLETPRLADVRRCANFVNTRCIVREHGRCVALAGERCGWFEKAVRPGGRMSGHVCAECGGEVPKRRRFCDRCRQVRRRSAYRESKHRNRVPCPQLTAPTPPNCQEFEAAQGTF